MKQIKKAEIAEMDRIRRLNLINSISGYKAANLIGTKGSKGENLAIFSSVIHLGSNPPLLGMITRPTTVPRHTLSNIREQGTYTINHINENLVKRAHYTSAKFEVDESEFEKCRIESEYLDNFPTPFVKESPLKIGMQLLEEIPIEANGTILLVGEIQLIRLEDKMLKEDGQLDLNASKVVSISGLNRYHQVREIAKLPYARPEELPDF